MKKLALSVLSLFSITAFAQPVILNGNNIPTVGYSTSISAATSSNVGNAGANQTWDFSGLFFLPIGTLNVITPSSSTIGSSFPNANLAYTLAGTNSFFNITSDKFEVLAYTITSPGSGDDYSPNPRTLLKFPFNYMEVVNDTCQKAGALVTPLTVTYDGYGTLITPSVTYTNVVRVKEDYGSAGIDYEWYTLNPLIILMQYRHSSNNLFYTTVSQVTTSIPEQNNLNTSLMVYPNPATEKIQVFVPATNSANTKLTLYNVLGETAKQFILTSGITEIKLEGIAPGVYLYTSENSQNTSSGKLIIK